MFKNIKTVYSSFIDGGHGFKMLERSEIFEVKQGPYKKI